MGTVQSLHAEGFKSRKKITVGMGTNSVITKNVPVGIGGFLEIEADPVWDLLTQWFRMSIERLWRFTRSQSLKEEEITLTAFSTEIIQTMSVENKKLTVDVN